MAHEVSIPATDAKGRTVRTAVVQAASVPFRAEACVDKAVRLTGEAAAREEFRLYPEAAIEVPGPADPLPPPQENMTSEAAAPATNAGAKRSLP